MHVVVKLKLKETAAKRQSVEWAVTEMQKQIFESQGIGGRFGIAFLGKVRTVYGSDAEMMHHLMKFVEREELALDEAELTIDDFLKKLEIREWAVQQYQSMQEKMKDMTPAQQRDLLHQQQAMMKEVAKESQDIAKQAEGMNESQKKEFIAQQVKRLQDQFQISQSCDHCHNPTHSSACQHGSSHGPSLPQNGTLGSVMTPEEQANFFKALYKS